MIQKISLALLLALAMRGASAASQTIHIGVNAGPQTEILQYLKPIAEKQGLDLVLVPIASDAQGAAELSSAQLEAICFDDGVAFERLKAKPENALSVAAQTVTLPIGLYSSHHIHKLQEVADGAQIALPNKPEQLSRALILLHNYGLIILRDNAGFAAGLRDVAHNPRHFRLQTFAPAALSAQLAHAELVALDFNAAARLNLAPARDGLGMEDGRSPYAGVLVVRSTDTHAPWLRDLLAGYRSDSMQHFILTHFQDSVRRPW